MLYQDYLTTPEAAQLLGFRISRLIGWRQRGCGPTYVRVPATGRGYWRGYAIAYRLSDLKAFTRTFQRIEGRMPRPGPGRMPKGAQRQRIEA